MPTAFSSPSVILLRMLRSHAWPSGCRRKCQETLCSLSRFTTVYEIRISVRCDCLDYYATLPIAAIITEYKSMCDLQAECEFGGSQAGSDPAVRNETHRRSGWAPILDADGDKLVLDLDAAPGVPVGQVFAWSNAGGTPQWLLAPSFGEWLAGLADVFGARKFRLYRRVRTHLATLAIRHLPSGEENELTHLARC